MEEFHVNSALGNMLWGMQVQLIDNHLKRYCFGTRVQLKRDGTRWRTRGEVKGKLANGVGIQYPSHYLGTWCIQALLPLMHTPRLPVVDWSDAPFDLNWFVRFAERRNLVSARVPSHFKRSLQKSDSAIRNLHIYIYIYMKIWLSGICSSSWSTLVESYQTVRHHAQ